MTNETQKKIENLADFLGHGFYRAEAVEILKANKIPFSLVNVDILYARAPAKNVVKLRPGGILYDEWQCEKFDELLFDYLLQTENVPKSFALNQKDGKNILKFNARESFEYPYDPQLRKINPKNLDKESRRLFRILKGRGENEEPLIKLLKILKIKKTPSQLLKKILGWDLELGNHFEGIQYVKRWNTIPDNASADPRFLLKISISPGVFGYRPIEHWIEEDENGAYNCLAPNKKPSNLIIHDNGGHSRPKYDTDMIRLEKRVGCASYYDYDSDFLIQKIRHPEKAVKILELLCQAHPKGYQTNPYKYQLSNKDPNPLVG